MSEAGRAGDEGDGGAAEPPAPAPGGTATTGRIVPGNVGSLDDVPEDAAGGVATEEEPAVGHA